jgi:hypothetical protein
MGLRGQEQRGDAHRLIHGRQLVFMKKVGWVARTPDDDPGAMLPAEFDGQPAPRGH